MSVPTLYGSESWVIRRETIDRQRGMRFHRSVKGSTRLDRIRNENIGQKLKVQLTADLATDYKRRWRQHVETICMERIHKTALS